MQHGFGPTWSLGVPPDGLVEGVQDLQERSVEFLPARGVYGNEYRGRHGDGTFMRFVGIVGETISYDHAPKEAAELFDRIIDSLCWRRR
jgi:hypothetical protein